MIQAELFSFFNLMCKLSQVTKFIGSAQAKYYISASLHKKL